MENIEQKLNCILLIDDDLATNFINKRILQKANLTDYIHVALNGKEALEYLSKKGNFESIVDYPQPQLILLDINMPVMDGWEFIETYRNLDIENKEDITIVMLSSSCNPADKAKAESIDVVAEFRQKPMNKVALLDILSTNFPELLEKELL
ncbi:Response regulator receiver domain-containing protein [Flavobacterium fluvii]|uniref:Response regulator receiver domain-containing protein n=1 Tax=Flavobacterium fluvii TaxID=468056 RepID=A0A1M5FMN2_9FLAO|nr:response regulator [Flavobacterium fluvii]SHF92412.1 Response regulator receiver domain-containing protein [Flavobacterium fluvii]